MISRFSIILITVIITVGCAKPKIIYQDYKPEQIIHYSQMKDIENISSYVFYLNKGDKIPLKMSINSELADIAYEDIHLILKQKVFFRIKFQEGFDINEAAALNEKDKIKIARNLIIYISPDSKRWASYTDLKTVEQIFGLKGGSFSFGMGLTKEEGLKIFLHLKTDRT